MKFKHGGIILDMEEIEFAKKHLKQEPWKRAYQFLMLNMEEYLKYKPKPYHGELSLPSFYREKSAYFKGVREFVKSADVTITCASAYTITGEDKYAKKVEEILKAWTNSITEYKTLQAEYDAHWYFQSLVYAAELIRNNKKINKKVIDDFLKWERKECYKLKKMSTRTNNLLYWLGCQMIATGIACEDKKLFDGAIKIYKDAIDKDIEKDGHMPKETIRTCRGMHYMIFALDALFYIAEAAKHQGVDLYNYKNKDGNSIRTAVDYVVSFVPRTEKWPWHTDLQDLSGCLRYHSGWMEIAINMWDNPIMEQIVWQNRPFYMAREGGYQTLFHARKKLKTMITH